MGGKLSFFVLGIVALGVYLSFYVFYVVFLLLANFIIKDKFNLVTSPKTCFGVVVPAFNEEIFLPRLLRSLIDLDYPSGLCDIIVVADNCSDKTADIASGFDVNILVRNDTEKLGKGYAIKYALDNMDINRYDAVLITDADSTVQGDALIHLDQTVKEGGKIIQCYNGVANPDDSWFTRILDVARTLGNEIFEPAKQKLGLSSHLQGNGMCFHRDIIQKYGWGAFSIGEDWEYYAKVVNNGERIVFQKDVRIYHQESATLKQATSQRIRWSGGRFAIIFKYGFKIFCTGLLERNFKKIDASFPLILPNPSLGINITLLCFISTFLFPLSMYRHFFILWFFLLAFMQFLLFVVAIMYTDNKFKNFMSLFIAPLFLVWKMGIDVFSILGMGTSKWVRTQRKN